jgi:glutathione synthase/RimK-type ligase-like ATP-grasp enzyme
MTMDKPVLVVLGSMDDPHVERVAKRLHARGRVDVRVVDYLNDARFAFRSDARGNISFEIDGRRLTEPYLVWDRTKIMPGSHLYVRGDERSSGYAAQEWRAFYHLLCGVNGEMAVNSLASRQCMIKPYQQRMAAKAGLWVPESMITNDRTSAMGFFDDCGGEMIMKSVSAGKVKPSGEGENIPYVVMTMRVAAGDLQAAEEAEIAFCPHFFQREIKKKHELRVIYVDGRMHVFAIDSQGSPISEVDWRKGIGYVDFTSGQIDPEARVSIDRFMRSMGLFSGSIDLIVDQDDRVWFLECNQDGAWGWLDDVVDGEVTETFAQAFENKLLAANGLGATDAPAHAGGCRADAA